MDLEMIIVLFGAGVAGLSTSIAGMISKDEAKKKKIGIVILVIGFLISCAGLVFQFAV